MLVQSRFGGNSNICLPGVLPDVFRQLLVVQAPLLVAHGDCIVNGISQFLGIPWVDDQTSVQALGSTSKLGQDHDTVSLLLCCDVLVRHQVHTVAGRGNQADVGNGVQRDQLVEGDGLVHEVDRHELDSAELAVDTSDELVDDGAEVLVLFDVLSRRNSDLDEDDLANPFGVLREEDFEGVQLLRNALDVVKTVNTDNELDALELLLKRSYPLLYLGLLETLVELLRVDTDGESADSNDLALEFDAVGRCRQSPGTVSCCIMRSRTGTYNIREQLLRK
jgi:hypothetical protein